jgi:hypothetical protein
MYANFVYGRWFKNAFKKNLNIFANSNLYSKRLYLLNQRPRADVLMKKTEGRKSRYTVPLMNKAPTAPALNLLYTTKNF